MRKFGFAGALVAVSSAVLWAVLQTASVASAAETATEKPAPLQCALSVKGFRKNGGLPLVGQKLRGGEPVTVATIGSSSTEGVGASSKYAAYPAWFGRTLAAAFPDTSLTVMNRGIGGQDAGTMTARFDRDVLAFRPDLVLWQTGTIEAVNDLDPAVFAETVRDGLRRLRAAGAEVMLINQQLSPKLEAKHPAYGRYVEQMRRLAQEENVPLFDRYESMRQWGATTPGGAAALISADELHMKDESYRCFGQAAAAVALCAAGGECPRR